MVEWALRRGEELIIDRTYTRRGLVTLGPAFDQQGDGNAELRGYVSTDWRIIRKLFPPDSVSPSDVLLEYGSGKGRVAIWVASHFAARRVIAVEYDPELTAAAKKNWSDWRGKRRCHYVDFVCQDARDYQIPDDVTVVYMFNPFMGEIFDQALANVTASLYRSPRELRVIYFYPIMHNALVEAGFTLDGAHRHALYAWATYRIGQQDREIAEDSA